MTVLRQTIRWSQPRRVRSRIAQLTPAEQAGVRATLRSLRARYRSLRELALALGTSQTTLRHVMHQRVPSASLALMVARLAGVSVSEVLGGAVETRACPWCGRAP